MKSPVIQLLREWLYGYDFQLCLHNECIQIVSTKARGKKREERRRFFIKIHEKEAAVIISQEVFAVTDHLCGIYGCYSYFIVHHRNRRALATNLPVASRVPKRAKGGEWNNRNCTVTNSESTNSVLQDRYVNQNGGINKSVAQNFSVCSKKKRKKERRINRTPTLLEMAKQKFFF